MRARDAFRSDRVIWSLLLAATVVRLAALFDKGVTYDGGFEDAIGYFRAAGTLARTGVLTFYGDTPSALVMPGLVGALALPAAFISDAWTLYLVVKLAMVAVSAGCIYLLYLLGARIGGTSVGLIAAGFLALSMPHVYTGTLVLTENVFMLALLASALCVIRLADEPSPGRLAAAVLVFCAAVYIRQTALTLLPAALAYLLARRHPWKSLARDAVVTVAVLVLVLSPWWVRNQRVFGAFVPFTSNAGYPLFEGTFQRFEPYGTGAFEAMDEVLRRSDGSETGKSRALAAAGRARIRERWDTDPAGLALTYGVMKPAAAWLLPFYWDKVFGVSGYWVLRIHALASVLGLALLGVFSVRSKARAEFLFLGVNVALITLGAAYYLGLSRYVYPYMPFLFVAIAYAADRLVWAARVRRGTEREAAVAA